MFEINDFDRIVKEIPAYYEKLRIYFTVGDLKYLHRSGRLSAAATVVGGALNIKPILRVTPEGKLEKFAKVIGRGKALQTIAEYTKKMSVKMQEVFIVHADCPADAKILEQKIKSVSPAAKVEIYNMGIIIGTHTGPDTIGMGFVSV